ncbi:MAG TPA: hypothetical protein VGH73_00805, partial [Thermoanaerobaculia bacterium]
MPIMVWLPLLLLLLPGPPAPPDIPDPAPLGIIDFYGLRSLSEAQARQALQIKVGDTVSDFPAAAQHRLEALPGVAQARFELVCCDSGKSILYVGIGEKGAPTPRFDPAPKGKVRLPAAVVQAGGAYEKALFAAVAKGSVLQDMSQGHALDADPASRAVEENFVALAARYPKQLRDVLHHSADAPQRALAAQVLAYAADKQAVVAYFTAGMRDPDSGVRNNSMRALWVMAASGRRIHVPVEPFIAMLSSLDWTDRNKASLALQSLTATRDPAILSQLRNQ